MKILAMIAATTCIAFASPAFAIYTGEDGNQYSQGKVTSVLAQGGAQFLIGDVWHAICVTEEAADHELLSGMLGNTVQYHNEVDQNCVDGVSVIFTPH